MRTYKFRAWNEKDKEWGNPGTIEANGFGTLSVWDASFLSNSPTPPGSWIIEQFTGATDKNGKDIFEGDILKVARCHTGSVCKGPNYFVTTLIEDGEAVGEVVWPYASFGWAISFEHLRHDDFDELCGANHRYEVIGNIHETPELLKR